MKPTQTSIEGRLQDMAADCEAAHIELANGELFITESNCSDWYSCHADLAAMHDRLLALMEDSTQPEPCPSEYERPEYTGPEYLPTGHGLIRA
jgi:hypothetical protein